MHFTSEASRPSPFFSCCCLLHPTRPSAWCRAMHASTRTLPSCAFDFSSQQRTHPLPQRTASNVEDGEIKADSGEQEDKGHDTDLSQARDGRRARDETRYSSPQSCHRCRHAQGQPPTRCKPQHPRKPYATFHTYARASYDTASGVAMACVGREGRPWIRPSFQQIALPSPSPSAIATAFHPQPTSPPCCSVVVVAARPLQGP
ncbi:hypothetical protein OF83DRAFT_1141110 [Amylostereum chailletii]|nr:hypothetical protein OF83DRAFT_1141110 [Amylostereum chailletii]